MRVSKAYSPIGIDVGPGEVRAVQLVRDASGVRLHRAACPTLDADGRSAADLLTDFGDAWAILRRRGFHGRRVVLAAPADATRASVVECPRTDAPEMVNQIARSELARAHRLEDGGFEMAWWEMPGRASKGGAVLAVACERAAAGAIEAGMSALGIDVVAIDLRSLALARACAPALHRGDGVLDAIVEIGWEGARVLMIAGGSVLYERELSDCGLSRAVGQIAAELMCDEEVARGALFRVGAGGEARSAGVMAPSVRAGVARLAAPIVDELNMSVSYAVRNYGLEPGGSIALVGAGAAAPGLDAVIGEGAGMRAAAWAAPGGEDGGRPALAAAWGLAARFD